jgi:hypothetical protein
MMMMMMIHHDDDDDDDDDDECVCVWLRRGSNLISVLYCPFLPTLVCGLSISFFFPAEPDWHVQ